MEETVTESMLKLREGSPSTLNEDTEYLPLINVEELPSGFKGYPEGTKVGFRPITLDELEALNSSDIEPERAVAMLLKSIHCTTLPSEELYYWDIIYVGVKRKLLAFGDIKGTIYKRCPKCGNIVSKSFKYTDIEFEELKVPNLPMKLDVCGKKLEFGLITMKDFLQIKEEQGALGVYARMIKNMSFDEAYKLVKSAYGVDIKKLKFVDQSLNYGIKPFIVECEGDETPCGEEVFLEVRSPFEIVFPEDALEGDNEFEVQYG